MRILTLDDLERRTVQRFDSDGFRIGSLLVADAGVRVAHARIEPGGQIGRHRAIGGQILLPLEGTAWVSGSEQREVAVRSGQAVYWSDGELHRTRTESGLLALIIEGEFAL